MEKFDIERMHRDCLEWCKNPVWKPWQKDYTLRRTNTQYQIHDYAKNLLAILSTAKKRFEPEIVCEFAHLIGLDVESYRKEAAPEPDSVALSGLLKGDGNLLSAHSAFRKALEDRFQPTLECLTNDRQDRIELLKLAVKATKGQDKDLRVVKAMIAYKRFAKLVGLDEPQPQTVESDAPDTPKAPQADTQDPRKVLVENGWTPKDYPFVDLFEKDGIKLWWSGDGWIIAKDGGYGKSKAKWNGVEPFEQWLSRNFEEFTAKPAEAAKKVNSQDEPISFLRSVITYPEMRDFHQEKGMVYFTWCEARYRFKPESNEVSLMHNGGITDNPSSILMTALVKLAAKA